MKLREMLANINQENLSEDFHKLKDFYKRKEILSHMNESGLSQLYKKYKEYDSGTISASRGDYSHKENKKRNKELKAILLAMGYSVTAIKGIYIENYKTNKAKEVHETSYIVFDYKDQGTLWDDLKRLGQKYDQDSITFSTPKNGGKYYLIGTNKTGYPGFNKIEELGKPKLGKEGEIFYSKIKGRQFVFESTCEGYLNFDCIESDYDINSRIVIHKIYENYIDSLNMYNSLNEG